MITGRSDVIVDVDASHAMRVMGVLARQLGPAQLGSWMHLIVGPYLKKRAENRFGSEGDDVVGSWAPLSEATVHIRESQGFPGPHPINVRTGELEQYITGGDPLVTASALGATMTWPGNLPGNWVLEHKLEVAQQGEGNAPPRPVIGLNERDLIFVLSALSVYLMDPAGEGAMSVEGGIA